MPLVKLIWSSEKYDTDGKRYNSIAMESITDWELVNDDDLEFLRNNLNCLRSPYNYFPTILVQDNKSIKEHIISITKFIADEKVKQAAEIADREAKAKLAAKRKEEKRLKKLGGSKDDELKLLAILQEKYKNTK